MIPEESPEMRQRRYRSCVIKRRHATKRKAKVAALSTRNKNKVMVVYRCLFCDGWHVGGNRIVNQEQQQ